MLRFRLKYWMNGWNQLEPACMFIRVTICHWQVSLNYSYMAQSIIVIPNKIMIFNLHDSIIIYWFWVATQLRIEMECMESIDCMAMETRTIPCSMVECDFEWDTSEGRNMSKIYYGDNKCDVKSNGNNNTHKKHLAQLSSLRLPTSIPRLLLHNFHTRQKNNCVWSKPALSHGKASLSRNSSTLKMLNDTFAHNRVAAVLSIPAV